MIRLEGLTKNFGRRCALRDLSLEIQAGEVFGLLGHNGAGNSTTFGLILGQLWPSAGEAFIRGISAQRERQRALQRVGAIFETPAFYDYLTGWSNLRILCSYAARVSDREIAEAADFVGIKDRLGDKVSTYSHGMRQRLALAQALLPAPDLLLLDEPGEGLDPEGMHELRLLLVRLNCARGVTVVLSSHLLSEVERICDRVAILNHGALTFFGRWNEWCDARPRFRIDLDDWPTAKSAIEAFGGETSADDLVVLPAGADIANLIVILVRAGVRIRAVEPMRETLEQIYLQRLRPRESLLAPISRGAEETLRA